MLVKGDKIVLKEKMGVFDNVGEICNVIDVGENGIITFSFGGGMHVGVMSADEFEIYFEKYDEPRIEDRAETILDDSDIDIQTVFDTCVIMSVRLPNGFVIVEHCTFDNAEDYDEEMGIEICTCRILDKISELESYWDKEEVRIANITNESEADEDCDCDGCVNGCGMHCSECCEEDIC
jgi:hypothetical protein